MIKIIFIFLLFSNFLYANEKNQIEITTDEGIEVFQKEKYYILKKNVKIKSNNFNLDADLVKAYFNEDLYDIQKIESNGNVKFNSINGIIAEGENLTLIIINEDISISGKNSILIINDLEMKSDGSIKVNNLSGEFILKGNNSELKSPEINILANDIDGFYVEFEKQKDIVKLNVKDKEIANIITENTNMFSKKAIYSKEKNIIELFEDVKIIRNNETIVGDYAKINTLNESYKIRSESSKKVKILIDNDE